MASPRLETFCCPNRDVSTQLVVSFKSEVFCGVCLGSASAGILLSVLQLLPKKDRGSRGISKASSSTTILIIISACDILGSLGKKVTSDDMGDYIHLITKSIPPKREKKKEGGAERKPPKDILI